MAKQSAALDAVQSHFTVTVAVDAGDIIVARKPLVDEGIVGAQQLKQAPVRTDLIVDEQLCLTLEGLPQVLVELRKSGGIGIDSVEIAQIEPLADEVLDEGARTGVGHHPLYLLLKYAGLV